MHACMHACMHSFTEMHSCAKGYMQTCADIHHLQAVTELLDTMAQALLRSGMLLLCQFLCHLCVCVCVCMCACVREWLKITRYFTCAYEDVHTASQLTPVSPLSWPTPRPVG